MKNSVQKILTIYRASLLPLAEGRQYANWGAEFTKKNENRAWDGVKEIKVDFTDLTSTEAELLGFPAWDESGLRLIPLWLYDHIASGQTLTCIDGEKVEVTDSYKDKSSSGYMDNDHRGGATAYGFMPSDISAQVS